MLRKYWQLLKRYMLPERRRVLVLAALIFSSMGLSLINPQILRGPEEHTWTRFAISMLYPSAI